MTASALVARDDISSMLASGWAAADWASLGFASAPPIQWEGRERPVPADGSLPYITLTIRHAAGDQAALAGADSTRRYNAAGIFTVQCFGSLTGGNGLEQAINMAIIAQGLYRGKQSENCVWFHQVAIKELGPSGGWYQVNLTAAFEYDEVR